MGVLIEGTCVLVRREAIDERFPGGWPAFCAQLPNQTLVEDDRLACVSFVHPYDVGAYINWLENKGLFWHHADDTACDIVVACQHNRRFTRRCAWAKLWGTWIIDEDVERLVLVCRSPGEPPKGPVNVPDDWRWVGSLSENDRYMSLEEAESRLIPLAQDDTGDTDLDTLTGEVKRVARTRVWQKHFLPSQSEPRHDESA